MPTVGDYIIIFRRSFVLETGGDIDNEFDFSLPDRTNRDSHMILQWIQDTHPTASNLRVAFEINGQEFANMGVDSSTDGTIHDAINSNLTKNGLNQFKARIVEGQGRVAFSDVVCFFRKDI